MLSLLALGSSVSWGAADFLAGVKARSMPAAAVVGWSQALALALLSVIVGLRLDAWTANGWVLWAMGAGATGATALVCFYAALSSGTMGVVAPVASLGVVVPVLLGLLGGDQPPAMTWVGMVVAVVGVALASGPELTGAVSARPVVLASVAAVGFGLSLYFLDRGARASLLHTLWGMRLTTVVVFLLAALALRTVGGGRARDLPMLAVIGGGDLLANALFAFASSRGMVSVASVLGSLYPVVTVLLARAVLDERLRRVQVAGVVLSIVGVAVIAM
jgi:drug/metabolite transporter (DMT)-like permease